MVKRHNDGKRRILLQAYVDQNIVLSAAASNMTNAEFIEAMFKRSQMADIPDDMPLADKQAKYVELDRTLRALGAVIDTEKEAEKKQADDKTTYAESDKQLTDKAILAVTDCILKPEAERSKQPIDLAVLRAQMLATGTQSRVKLEPKELMELTNLRVQSRMKEVDAQRREQEARLKVV